MKNHQWRIRKRYVIWKKNEMIETGIMNRNYLDTIIDIRQVEMIINKTTYAVVREYDIVRKMILNKILTGT